MQTLWKVAPIGRKSSHWSPFFFPSHSFDIGPKGEARIEFAHAKSAIKAGLVCMIDRFADTIVLVGRATVILLMFGSAQEYGKRDQLISALVV
jgi:Na+/alanine symporter